MKKVGIITFHFAQNVGAVLQCLALNEYLKRCGYDPFVINYRPKYHTAKYSAWQPPIYLASQKARALSERGVDGYKLMAEAGKSFLASMKNNCCYFKNVKRAEVFNDFLRCNLNQSEAYLSIEELIDHPPTADIYICGSDQVWNKSITNEEFDDAYFLRFGNDEIKRFAYAVSMGETDILGNPELFLDKIQRLNEIFLRESTDCEKLSELTGQPCKNVKDPTLLLTAEDYRRFENRTSVQGDYVFVYTVLKSEAIKRIVEALTRDEERSVIDGSTHDYIKGNKPAYRFDPLCGPGDFLSYIRDAEYVITNSFHGTVFSILYHKNFITVANNKRNSRMEELLDYIGLKDHLIYNNELRSLPDLPPIDYSDVEQRLLKIQKHDSSLLISCLG